jgi:hypothetical protein
VKETKMKNETFLINSFNQTYAVGKRRAFGLRVMGRALQGVRVRGTRVDLGAEDLRDVVFFAHRNPHALGRLDAWSVSEASTGLRVAKGKTRTEAVAKACAVIQREGTTKVREALSESLPVEGQRGEGRCLTAT